VSQANVERMRAAFEYHAREGGLDPSVFHPDLVWTTRSDLPDAGVYGWDGIAAVDASWTESFDDYRIEVKELIDFGDWVAAVLVLRGYVKGTETPMEQHEVWISRFENGRVVEVREFRTLAEAEEALGLAGG
jgi:ketosteroid isomerase-like protein